MCSHVETCLQCQIPYCYTYRQLYAGCGMTVPHNSLTRCCGRHLRILFDNDRHFVCTTPSPTPHHQRRKREPHTHLRHQPEKCPAETCTKIHTLWISFGITLHFAVKCRKTPHTNTIEQLFVKIAKTIKLQEKRPNFSCNNAKNILQSILRTAIIKSRWRVVG